MLLAISCTIWYVLRTFLFWTFVFTGTHQVSYFFFHPYILSLHDLPCGGIVPQLWPADLLVFIVCWHFPVRGHWIEPESIERQFFKAKIIPMSWPALASELLTISFIVGIAAIFHAYALLCTCPSSLLSYPSMTWTSLVSLFSWSVALLLTCVWGSSTL